MQTPARLLLVLAVFTVGGCKKDAEPRATGSGTTRAAAPAKNTVSVTIAYGSEKKTWLEEQVRAFNAARPTTRSGRPIVVAGKAMGSGEAMNGIVNGTL